MHITKESDPGHAAREATRLAIVQHGIVADRADLLGLLLDLLLRLASQPTLNAFRSQPPGRARSVADVWLVGSRHLKFTGVAQSSQVGPEV
jgi:hypothetical protein